MRIIRVITVIMAVVFALNMAACCGPDTTEVKKTEIIRPTRAARSQSQNTTSSNKTS